MSQTIKTALAGIAAGAVNGLFGAGGGMVLVPLLSAIGTEESRIFSTSIRIIFPICVVSLIVSGSITALPLKEATPYLLGGTAGGILASLTARRIPVLWLHRILGIFILWGGIRYLC